MFKNGRYDEFACRVDKPNTLYGKDCSQTFAELGNCNTIIRNMFHVFYHTFLCVLQIVDTISITYFSPFCQCGLRKTILTDNNSLFLDNITLAS